MCGQVSNNEHATSHHLTRLNVEFAGLIAMCNMIYTHYARGSVFISQGETYFATFVMPLELNSGVLSS